MAAPRTPFSRSKRFIGSKTPPDSPEILAAMQPTLRQLELVLAIARTKSVSEAARQIHITQSAASRSLNAVENQLGMRLFRRERLGLVATPAGHLLADAAQEVHSVLQRAVTNMGVERDRPRDALRLVVQTFSAYGWIGQLLARLRQQNALLSLRPVLEARRRPWQALRDGDVDLAIVHEPLQGNGVQADLLFADDLVAVLATSDPRARRSALTMADLDDATSILHREGPRSPRHAHRVAAPAVEPLEAALELARLGLAAALLPRWTIRHALAQGDLITVALDPPQRLSWYLAVGVPGERNIPDGLHRMLRDLLAPQE